jgi:hypothetical protein
VGNGDEDISSEENFEKFKNQYMFLFIPVTRLISDQQFRTDPAAGRNADVQLIQLANGENTDVLQTFLSASSILEFSLS